MLPHSAPFPVPTMIATGVARPRSQGQAVAITEINIVNENTTNSPDISHKITVTTGTK